MTTTAKSVRCGSCGESNVGDAKFCESCGHSLYEKCSSCDSHVLLTQRFCGSCGCDLQEKLVKRKTQYNEMMKEAVSSAKQHDYDRGIALLQRVASVEDYRFCEVTKSAKEAIPKISALQERALAATNKAVELAKDALERDDKAEVVRQLQSIPPVLLSEEAKLMLDRVCSFTEHLNSLEAALKDTINRKNWIASAGVISQLLNIAPQEKQFIKLGKQISEKLVVRAHAFGAKQKYKQAIDQLDAVPGPLRDTAWNAFYERTSLQHWLHQQLMREPFVTPLLGRISKRYAKESPEDSNAKSITEQIAKTLRTSECRERMIYPKWKGDHTSWLGGEYGMLAIPSSIEIPEASDIRESPGRFHVAIGLAIQGLGKGRVTENFVAKKKKLLGSFGRKTTSCWGLDFGSSCLKAVKMDLTDTGLELTDSFSADYETPLNRAGAQDTVESILKPAAERFLEKFDLGDLPVWSNLPSHAVVTRFVRLPPVKEKQAKELLEREIQQKIPIPIEDLSIVRWMSASKGAALQGRPATLVATKQSSVEKRIRLLETLGITVTGLQADPIALVNFANHEFAEHWKTRGEESNATTSNGESSQGFDEETSPDEAFAGSAKEDAMASTVALVDCGASSTSLVLISGEAQWAWSIENAGESFTHELSRRTKKTHHNAEIAKRNVADLKFPTQDYEGVEQQLEKLRTRMNVAFNDALKQNPRFKILSSWYMGGGSLTHMFASKVLSNDSETP